MTPVKTKQFGLDLWVNPVTEERRMAECLCMHCELLGKCAIARELAHIGKVQLTRVMVTTCRAWQPLQTKKLA